MIRPLIVLTVVGAEIAPVSVSAPLLVTLNLLTPATCKLMKSAAEPTPVAGSLTPIYVPPFALLLPFAIAEPSWSSEVTPVPATGAPVSAKPVVLLLEVTVPVNNGLLTISKVRLRVALPATVKLLLVPGRKLRVWPLATVWSTLPALPPWTVNSVPAISAAWRAEFTKAVPL